MYVFFNINFMFVTHTNNLYHPTMSAGDRLKELRKELGLSQSEIANLLNVAQQVVSYYEKTGSIDTEKLITIARTYNIDIRYFFDDKPLDYYRTTSLYANSTQGPDIPVGWQDLLEEISALEYDKIKFIETVIKALLKEFSG